jgi:hypothetical protein
MAMVQHIPIAVISAKARILSMTSLPPCVVFAGMTKEIEQEDNYP